MDVEKLIEEAQQLDDLIQPGPFTKCGEDMEYWIENRHGQIVEEFRDRDSAVFFARARTLVPELAAALRETTSRLEDAKAELAPRIACIGRMELETKALRQRANEVEKERDDIAAANVAANAEIVRLQGLLDEARRFAKENAEHALDIAKERDAARAELAEECQLTDDASRLVVLCLDALGEDVARLANEPYEANRLNSLRRGIPDRIKALRAELARLTTPRPIAEAPKDGRDVLVCWGVDRRNQPCTPEVMYWDDERAKWMRGAESEIWEQQPTHFLPLKFGEVYIEITDAGREELARFEGSHEATTPG